METRNKQDRIICGWIKKRKVTTDKFQFNEAKFKELRITLHITPIVVNGKEIDVVSSAKLLGVNISKDLEWNIPISEIVKEVSRLYFLRAKILGGNGTSTRVSILAD